MILEWFNARDAVACGESLADIYLSKVPTVSAKRRKPGRSVAPGADFQAFLQRAAREAGPLKLNLFKRAKLLETFKSRLLAQGLDQRATEELTHLLLVQLSTGQRAAVPDGRVPTAAVEAGASKRVPALLAEADALYAEGRYADAANRLREALESAPRHANAHANLGVTLCKLGRYDEGERELRRAIALNETCPGAHLSLGTLLRARGDLAASETALRRAVKQQRRDAQALVDLGLTLGMRGRLGDARNCFEKAMRLKPRSANTLCGLAWLASREGRFEQAERLYRDALASEPRHTVALASLAQLRRMTAADGDWFASVQQMLAGDVSSLEEAKLRFALGKYFDDLGNYSSAFEQYKRANELQSALATPYDRAARKAFVDDMIRIYTRERLARPSEGASGSRRPVFVVGMMRSGTSLVEQIIASHPGAVGAGELEFWNATVLKYQQDLRREFPDAAFVRQVADSYSAILSGHSKDSGRIVDKAPGNAEYLGLIHSVFPQAKILYLRRDPVDVCLSCYFQDFGSVASFTFDLSDLAHHYREHHRLVAHWRSVLPQDVLLEVPYAELVRDQEGWSRKIIEFIGLPWDPRVLEFHKTERAVTTASLWQVRQKIYSSSVGRWKNYEKFIGPLLKLRDLSA